jgi:hypothetical protein
MPKNHLPTVFFDMVSGTIDETGIFPPPLLAKKSDGTLEVGVISGPPQLVFHVAKQHFVDAECVEFVYGLDRYTKPNQGSEFNDVFVGAFCEKRNGIYIWKPYVINYQNEPRIVRDYDWNNEVWNTHTKHELKQMGMWA